MRTEPIFEFFGDYRFLSNFFPAELMWNGILWPTSEHAYQAAKTLDRAQQLEMSRILSPGAIKRYGKLVQIRDDWEEVKFGIMYEIVRAKFEQNPHLKQQLLDTGLAHLEEGNSWNDRVWGVCPARSGNGKNWLGKILMELRDEWAV